VHRTLAYDDHEERLADTWIALMNAVNVTLYEASDGRVAGRIPSGLPLMLLRTVGRRTGRWRTVTVAYLRDGDSFLVVGSKGGLSRAPHWVANAAAHPVVDVQIGADHVQCIATRLDDADAAAAIERFAPYYRAFEDYGVRAAERGRTIPVLRLTPFGRA
jgi:deazaflavin-dependent oxidoreductase (nitroreductase family)